MTELINSLKTLAYGGGSQSIADRRSSTGQLRIIPLLNLGRNDSNNDSSFTQWRDAMRMVSRLPGGLPPEFRLRLWENLSDRYMQDHGISWSRVMSKCRVTNSRDVEIADQIEKDLHRTGCTGFEGGKQAMLKRVLVSYSRWNPSVGYCQGFNMIGAMLLQMTSGDETLTLKVLIFLIEGVLPQGYFSQGLRGLAVDMATFREILRLRKPTLHNHLTVLQNGDENPPLTDVFTMHWFLTLFIHCLPTNSVLRIWDLVFLEGSEVLLRTALVLWTAIEPRILAVSSADEFYSVMGVVTREMLEFGLMDPNALVKCIVSVGPFPFPSLAELRQQQRALIQQDTPYKSFFLAKRELDNLKRHYAAMKDRQKATTIILRGLEASRVRVPGQRSNSLFVASSTIKKQMQANSFRPKMRRASSGSKGGGALNNNNNHNLNNGNINNRANTGAAGGGHVVVGGKVAGKQITMTWDKAAPKIRSKTFRRRRTASASSGHTTDSSSSTELCDSNSCLSSDSSDSEGVWSETDNRWKKPKKSKKKSDSPGSVSLKSNKSNLSLCPPPKEGDEDLSQIDNVPVVPLESTVTIENGHDCVSNYVVDDETLPPLEAPGSEEKSPGGSEEQPSSEESPDSTGILCSGGGDGSGNNGGKINRDISNNGHKILDTNDSQHFLEEISRLGKSDSFYENLSKRICELQFQNLRILNSCNTTIDPKALAIPQFERSPLPSPIHSYSPKSFGTTGSSITQDDIFLAESSLKLTPNPTPKSFLSPRGSVSSISEISPLRSPLSPSSSHHSQHNSLSLLHEMGVQHQLPRSRRSSYTKRTSSGGTTGRSTSQSQSISSIDIPDICVDGPKISENGTLIEKDSSNSTISYYTSSLASPLKKNNSKSGGGGEEEIEFFKVESEKQTAFDNNNRKEDDSSPLPPSTSSTSPSPSPSKGQNSPRKGSDLTLDLSSCKNQASLFASGAIKPFTPLKTPDFLQLNPLSHPSGPETTSNDLSGDKSGKNNSKVDVRSCLVSPVLSPDLTETNVGGKWKKGTPPNRSPTKDICIPPRPKNFPVSPAEKEDFLLAYTGKENGCCRGLGCEGRGERRKDVALDGINFDEELLDGEIKDDDEFIVKSGGSVVEEDLIPVVFPTTACPCQCQTTEEINAVIRQNIAILQRLKLKPAYDDNLDGSCGGAGGDDEYEDIDEYDEEEASSCSDYSTGFPELSNFTNNKGDDSSDRDSGLPTCSSKNSLSRKDSSTSENCGGGKKKSSSRTISTSGEGNLRHQDSSGCSSGGSSSTIAPVCTHQQRHASIPGTTFTVVTTTTSTAGGGRRRNSSGGGSGGGGMTSGKPLGRKKSLTRTSSSGSGGGQMASGSSTASCSSTGGAKSKQKKNFNPFPTTRKIRVRTSKFGLY